MSLKEFSVRCSAITHITARAYGIAQAIGPKLPTSVSRPQTDDRQSERRTGFNPNRFALAQRA